MSRPRSIDVVHGVTEKGIQVSPGVYIQPPPPPDPPRPRHPHRFMHGQVTVWGWSCDVPGCPYGRAKVGWTEAVARRALEDHKRTAHP